MPAQKRSIELAVFDLDGVIYDIPPYEETSSKIGPSSWNVLFSRLGIYDQHEQLKRKFISGEFKSYIEWSTAACEALKEFGLRKGIFEGIINTRQMAPNAQYVVDELHRNGIKVATISGSFGSLSKKAKRVLGLDAYVAHCNLLFDSQGVLTAWKLERCDYAHKPSSLRRLAKRFRIGVDRCAYIGHEVNDIQALRTAGLGIALNATKESVIKAADVDCHGDISKILGPILSLPDQIDDPETMDRNLCVPELTARG
jgi:phosphoserine phosphatase